MNSALPSTGIQPCIPLRSWTARLALRFAEQDHKVELAHCSHEGPLRVQRLFYPEPYGKAHCYLLHPPGGVATGDELHIDVVVDSGEALVTTPSAGRFYTVGQFTEEQVQAVKLAVKAGRLEWLPQETILFNGVNARLTTRIDLSEGSQLAYWDVLVLGRPACDEPFTEGTVSQLLDIRRENRPLLRERLALTAGDRLHASSMGLQSASTIGLFVLTDQLVDEFLDSWLGRVNSKSAAGPFSVTQRGELLVARYLGADALQCRSGFADLWRSVSVQRGDRCPATPRIWHT